MTAKTPRPFLLAVALMILFGLAFFAWIFQFIQDIPNADDYDLFLNFVISYVKATNATERFHLLFSPHNEHLAVSSRAAALLSYYLLGRVSFAAMLVCSNLLLLGSLGLILRTAGNIHWQLAPLLALIFLQPQFGEVLVWSSAAVSLSSMLFFAIAAISCPQGTWLGRFIALLCCLLAVLSNAAGLAVAPAILITQLLCRRWRDALFWTVVSAAAGLLVNLSSAATLPQPSQFAEFALSLLGSALGFGNGTLSFFAGVGLVIYAAALTLLGYFRKNEALYGILLFSIITTALIAWGRHGGELESAYLTSRYRLFSVLALCVVFLSASQAALALWKNRQHTVTFALASVALCFSIASFYYFSQEITFRSPLLEDSIVRWQLAEDGLLHPTPTHAKSVLARSIALGIYQPPHLEIERHAAKTLVYQGEAKKRKILAAVEHFINRKGYLHASGWAFIPGKNVENTRRWLQLSSEQQSYTFPLETRQRPDVTRHFRRKGKSLDLDGSGFAVVIACGKIAAGDYNVRILIEDRQKLVYRPLTRLRSFTCSQ